MPTSHRAADIFGHINRSKDVSDEQLGAGGEDVSDIFATVRRPKIGADGKFATSKSKPPSRGNPPPKVTSRSTKSTPRLVQGAGAEGSNSRPSSGADRVRIGVGRIRPDSGSRGSPGSRPPTTRTTLSCERPPSNSSRSERSPPSSPLTAREVPGSPSEGEDELEYHRSTAAEEGQAHYAALKARIEAAKSSLDRMSNETGDFNTKMNHIESEFTWWSDKVTSADCDDDWNAEMPSWDDVYTKICRPGTAAGVPSKTTKRLGDSTFLTTDVQHEEPVTEFISSLPSPTSGQNKDSNVLVSPPASMPGTPTRIFKRASIARPTLR